MTRVCPRHKLNDGRNCLVCRTYRKVAERHQEMLCLNCDVPLFRTSGGKMQCRSCGYIAVCCSGER